MSFCFDYWVFLDIVADILDSVMCQLVIPLQIGYSIIKAGTNT